MRKTYILFPYYVKKIEILTMLIIIEFIVLGIYIYISLSINNHGTLYAYI